MYPTQPSAFKPPFHSNPAAAPAPAPSLQAPHQPVIKVMGMGGAGSNAVNRMIELGLTGIDFIAANTDSQALRNSLAPTRLQLGPAYTRGLGAGGNPEVGRAAAEESAREIKKALEGADMVFLTAGMGGGTGTGSIPVAAQIAKEMGIVTVGVVSTPFSFEIGRRQVNARDGLARLRPHTHTLITVPNDRLLTIAGNLSLDLAFRLADDILRQGIQGITELITQTGLINIDFAHVRQMMQMGGGSMLSIGIGEGPSKALKAVQNALNHPLLESTYIGHATGMIANFTAGRGLSFQEIAEALSYLQAETGNHCDLIPGVILDENMGDRTQVILIITGLGATPVDPALLRPKAAAQPAAREAAAAPALHAAEAQPLPRRTVIPFTPEPEDVSPVALPASAANLDLPAFMRRRR